MDLRIPAESFKNSLVMKFKINFLLIFALNFRNYIIFLYSAQLYDPWHINTMHLATICDRKEHTNLVEWLEQ